MKNMFLLSIFLCTSCFATNQKGQDADNGLATLNSIFECERIDISKKIRQRDKIVVFFNYQGFKQFVASNLNATEYELLLTASRQTLEELNSKNEIDIKVLKSVYYKNLKKTISDNLRKSESTEYSCSAEIDAILNSVLDDKHYQLYNPEFTEFLYKNNISLSIRGEQSKFWLLSLLSLENEKIGLCKTYSQTNNANVAKVQICN